jgi:hypothetical protein
VEADQDTYRRVLERRLHELEKEERALQEQIQMMMSRLEAVRQRRQWARALYEDEFPKRRRRQSQENAKFAALTWTEAVAHALEEMEGPVEVEELWLALQNGGFETASADPRRTLRVVLSRMKTVERPSRGLYELKR